MLEPISDLLGFSSRRSPVGQRDRVLSYHRGLVYRRLISWARRRWYVLVALLLCLVSVKLGVVAIIAVIAYLVWKRHQSHQRDRVAMHRLGGPDNYRRVEQICATWEAVMVDVGLSMRPNPTAGIGERAALAQHLYRPELAYVRAAQGDHSMRVPQLQRVDPSSLGLDFTVSMLPGQTVASFEAVTDRLAAAWALSSVRAVQGSPGHVVLTLVLRDPLAEVPQLTAGAPLPASVKNVQLGLKESGAPLLMSLDQTSSVIGGVPGYGKSVAMNVALYGIAQVPEIQVVGIDCKAMIEFADWAPRMSAQAGDQQSALEVLTELDKLGQQRLQMLRGSGSKSLARAGYTVENPLIVVMIDECAELFIAETSAKEHREVASQLATLVSRGVRLYRAAGISYILATQRPTTDAIPSLIRDNCPSRIAFRCKTPENSVAILGAEVSSCEFPPTQIREGQRGYCVVSDSEGWARAKTFFIDEETSAWAATQTAPLRRSLSDLMPLDPLEEELHQMMNEEL